MTEDEGCVMDNRKWSRENFEEHHRENPEIYDMFCKFAFEVAKVRPHYSAKMVYFRIRWFTQIEERGSQFKLDDGWVSHYARKFMEDYPQYEGFFGLRARKNGYFTEEVNDQSI